MRDVPLADLPATAVIAWVRLRDALRAILGDDLVALWGYGARAVSDPPRKLGDVDSLAIVRRAPGARIARRLREAKASIAREVGIDLDVSYVLARDVRRVAFPLDRVRTDGWRHVSWAFHRAHLLAGRYVHVHGARPEDVLRAPTWVQLERALRHELDHLERHVAAGDEGDVYEASYAILNGARILHSAATRDVVISKRAAGEWALGHLPRRWHGAIKSAIRAYDGMATAADAARLRAAMAPFVALVRERIP